MKSYFSHQHKLLSKGKNIITMFWRKKPFNKKIFTKKTGLDFYRFSDPLCNIMKYFFCQWPWLSSNINTCALTGTFSRIWFPIFIGNEKLFCQHTWQSKKTHCCFDEKTFQILRCHEICHRIGISIRIWFLHLFCLPELARDHEQNKLSLSSPHLKN